jgi:hypothetical protein
MMHKLFSLTLLSVILLAGCNSSSDSNNGNTPGAPSQNGAQNPTQNNGAPITAVQINANLALLQGDWLSPCVSDGTYNTQFELSFTGDQLRISHQKAWADQFIGKTCNGAITYSNTLVHFQLDTNNAAAISWDADASATSFPFATKAELSLSATTPNSLSISDGTRSLTFNRVDRILESLDQIKQLKKVAQTCAHLSGKVDMNSWYEVQQDDCFAIRWNLDDNTGVMGGSNFEYLVDNLTREKTNSIGVIIRQRALYSDQKLIVFTNTNGTETRDEFYNSDQTCMGSSWGENPQSESTLVDYTFSATDTTSMPANSESCFYWSRH